jgi:outer membrane protein assembly factor BamB
MRLLIALCAAGCLLAGQEKATWPQFRGPNSSGVAVKDAAPPVEFSPTKLVAWKTALPPGHSSPAIWGSRIFLTSFESGKLEVLCLARKDGAILWRRSVPASQFEKVHEISSLATATPAVDGERVYAYFGSYGLIAFDLDGKQQWGVPLSIPKTNQSSGTSPIVAGELVILNRDAAEDAFLLAVDRRTGKTVWKTAYPPPAVAESYSTPVVWRDQIVVHRFGGVEAYNLKDGQPAWSVKGTTTGTSTVVADKDMVYAATWQPGGEADQWVSLPDYATLLKQYDKDGDGQLSEAEFPADLAFISRPDTPKVKGAEILIKPYFKNIDANKDGFLQKAEYDNFVAGLNFAKISHGLIAIKDGGIVWKETTAVPEVPSPLLYNGRLYMIRSGGIVTCLDAPSGKVIYRARLGAPGAYFASPVAAGGKIYAASGDGVVSVFSASGDKLEVLARNDLQEPIFATPAVVEGTIYVRTAHYLYAFGPK